MTPSTALRSIFFRKQGYHFSGHRLKTGCGICNVLAKKYVDENGELAGQYGVMSIPALKVFKDGEIIEDMVGVHQKDQLMEVIEKNS